MNKKIYKIIQVCMIGISMLLFLGSHLLLVLKGYIDKPNFFGGSIGINILIDTSLTLGFVFLFVVTIMILLNY